MEQGRVVGRRIHIHADERITYGQICRRHRQSSQCALEPILPGIAQDGRNQGGIERNGMPAPMPVAGEHQWSGGVGKLPHSRLGD